MNSDKNLTRRDWLATTAATAAVNHEFTDFPARGPWVL